MVTLSAHHMILLLDSHLFATYLPTKGIVSWECKCTLAIKMFGTGQKVSFRFDPSLLTNKLWLIFMGLKQKKISKWPTQKKTQIFKTASSWKFFAKILWIGPWISSIDWCGSTYMVMRLSDNTNNAFFARFLSLRHTASWPYRLSHTNAHQFWRNFFET